jgi:hypothetical protein
MPCCGQKRAAFRSRPEPRASAPPSPSPVEQAPPPPPPPTAEIPRRAVRTVQYTERSSVRVRGSATGRHYEFSGSNPVQAVDARDAPAMLATRFFRAAYGPQDYPLT